MLLFHQDRPPPTLRPHQVDVVGRVRQRVMDGHRWVILQMATGGGKALCGAEIVRRAVERNRRALVLVHRRNLVEQISGTLDWLGVPHGVLMSGETRHRHVPVQVASRDSLLAWTERSGRMSLPEADIVWLDEAHHVADPKCEYLRLLKRYEDKVVIGTTATPVPGLQSAGFGAMECAVAPSELVKRGFLVPVRCYSTAEKVRKGERKKKGIVGDPVAEWKRRAEGRPTIVFAANVKASLAVVDRFGRAGIPAAHIDAETPDDERKRILASLHEGRTLVLSNCSVFTEGTDLPLLSCCQLLRPCRSYVLFCQAVGRVMRPHAESGKKDAVVIDHGGAVVEHGFPDEDAAWSLDEDEEIEARHKKAKKEGTRATPICCPRCGCLFSGTPACPECGHVLRSRKEKKDAVTQQGVLFEVERGAAAGASPESRLADASKFWVRCVYSAVHGGRAAGAASHMFKNRFGKWPEQFPGLAEAVRHPLPMSGQGRHPAALVFPWALKQGGGE